jgi:hypothetical protein
MSWQAHGHAVFYDYVTQPCLRCLHLSPLCTAGRWDLHNAIARAGGYREVGRLLGRRPSWPVPKDEAALLSLSELEEALTEAAAAAGGLWQFQRMPSVRQLQLAGRQDLVQVSVYTVCLCWFGLCTCPAGGLVLERLSARCAH